MEMRFQLTLLDLLIFNLFMTKQSQYAINKMRKQRKILVVFMLMSLLLIMLINPKAYHSLILWYVGFAVIFIYIMYPYYFYYLVHRRMSKYLGTRKKELVLGHYHISISTKGIKAIETESLAIDRFEWKDINNYMLDKAHVYVFTTSSNAIIIPFRAFLDKKECRQFLKKMNASLQPTQ